MNELKETNKKNVNAYEDLNNKFKRLNELYDSCENEKLAVQADYEILKEQYDELKINAEAYEEAAREYESICVEHEKYKLFINALFNEAKELNITWNKSEEEKKEVKKENKKDNDDSSKVTVELNKQTNTKKEGRIINQEMNVPGYTINM